MAVTRREGKARENGNKRRPGVRTPGKQTLLAAQFT